MPLLQSCRQYEGKNVCFIPGYGWGWSCIDSNNKESSVDYAEIDQAGHFHIKVHRLFSYRDELRGIVGRVVEPGHKFHEYWAAVWSRSTEDYDFAERLGPWDIRLGPGEPIGGEAPYTCGGSPGYVGYGTVKESLQREHEGKSRREGGE